MSPSLDVMAPTPDTLTGTDRPKCGTIVALPLPSFGVVTTHTVLSVRTGPPASTLTSNTPSESICGAYLDSDDVSTRPRTCARQWTGMPIRAIIPLPRRKHVLNAKAQHEQEHEHEHEQGHDDKDDDVNGRIPTRVPPTFARPYLTAGSSCFWDDLDAESSDSGAENEGTDGEEDRGCDEGRGAARYCSYESITAAEGLLAWSFEELRAECYAQSLIARGTKPPPVVQPMLAIPPAFVPRVIPRNS